MPLTPLTWFKSSYSSNDGPECVEVAISPTTPAIHVRDSKDPDGTRLAFTDHAWSTFLDAYSA
ncbi:DUF397 domain-containing protein [Streptomyces sp. YS415]|uniref:DUF397 domain-containing protein n=1 Tax=Streptomyces sp. YS415 TaxID=2944806 RepID=UPI0020202323|nr:DUF397 domain-containing protein [Streptomyces sp. YS415]MCL7425302.1 DUF397 domain-containing protein [Streptomyces sp. YS415]